MLRSVPTSVTKWGHHIDNDLAFGSPEKFGKKSFREALEKRKAEHRDELVRQLDDSDNDDDEVA